MRNSIQRIPCGGVNCFLIQLEKGFILIDTGFITNRKKLLKTLRKFDCNPKHIKLILQTHGDIDHAGNTAYFNPSFPM